MILFCHEICANWKRNCLRISLQTTILRDYEPAQSIVILIVIQLTKIEAFCQHIPQTKLSSSYIKWYQIEWTDCLWKVDTHTVNLVVIQLFSLIIDANAAIRNCLLRNYWFFFEAPFNSRYFQPVEKKVSRAALYNDRKDDNQRCGCQHGLARIGHSISNGQGKGHGAT